MNQRNLNELAMIKASSAVLKQNQEAWKDIEGFVELVNILDSYVEALELAARVQVKGNTTGITEDKDSISELAVDKAFIVCKLARVVARATHNHTLFTLVDATKPSLYRTPYGELASKLTTMLNGSMEVQADMEKYGFEPHMETEAREAIAAFEVANPSTRIAIAGRAAKTATVPQLIRGAKETLLMIDDLMELLEEKNPEMVATFQGARSVVQYGTRHKPKDVPPAPPMAA